MNNLSPQGTYGGGGDQGSLLSGYWMWKRAEGAAIPHRGGKHTHTNEQERMTTHNYLQKCTIENIKYLFQIAHRRIYERHQCGAQGKCVQHQCTHVLVLYMRARETDKKKRETGTQTQDTHTLSVFHSLSARLTSRKRVNYGSNDPAMNKPVGGSRAPIRHPSSGY